MDLISSILDSLHTQPRIMLATIIATSGSTPASVFSKMVITDEGKRSVGTVGGGCMEGDVLQAAKQMYEENKAAVLSFHLNEDEMIHGLICGGSLDVLVEPVTRDAVPLFQELKARRDNGEDCVLATLLENGVVRRKALFLQQTDGKDAIWKEKCSHPASPPLSIPDLRTHLDAAVAKQKTIRHALANGELILEPVAGRPHLIIFGGGHVSKYVSSAAAMSGFRVSVIDDRPQYANPERFPEAEEAKVLEFYEAFSYLTITPSTYIVIVTRGHHSDEELLGEAIKTPARYIGMIGSKRKVLKTFENLLAGGASLEQLQRVHAPMGLDIGAITAEEIGVSIVAELIQIRRGASMPVHSMAAGMEALFKQLPT